MLERVEVFEVAGRVVTRSLTVVAEVVVGRTVGRTVVAVGVTKGASLEVGDCVVASDV